MPKDDYIPSLNSAVASLGVPPSRKASDYLNAYSGWVFSCVNAIAQEVASLNLHLYKKKYIRGKLELEEVTEHEALSALTYVNAYSTFYEHIFSTQVYIELLGESYWGILRNPDKSINSMWILRPDWLEIRPSDTRLIDKYIYRVGGTFGREEVILEPEDVIPFKMLNPNSPYRGKGSVQAGAMAIDLDDFSASWNRNFFYNSGLPSMFFKTDKSLDQASIDRFLANFRAKFQGVNNAHKIAFLTNGLDIKEVGQNFRDMDFSEQRKSMRDEILAIFRVPKSVLGITEDVNRANAEQGKKTFIDNVITPKIRMIVDHLNEFYLKNWGDEDLFFDYDDPSPEDTELKLKVYESGLSKGWLTINEVREMENLEAIDGGDVLFIPNNVTELGAEPQSQEEGKMLKRKRKAKTKARIKTNMPIPPRRIDEIKRERLKDGLKTDLIKIVSLIMKQEPEQPRDMKEEFKQAYWKRTVEKTDLWESQMKTDLVKIFKEQEQLVIGNLDEKTTKALKKTSVNAVLFVLNEEVKRWKLQFKPFIKKIVEDKALEELDFLGVGGSLKISDEVINFLEDKGLEFCRSVNKTTRERLKLSLIEGVELEEDNDQLAQRVKKIYTDATEARANTIVRSEVLRANNFAVQESYRQSNIVVGKEWLTAIDERTCPYCNELDAKILPINAKFYSSNFGEVREPPLHPNCRCTTIPVMDKDLMKSVPDEMLMLKAKDETEKAKEEVRKAKQEKKIILEEAKREKEKILKEAEEQAVNEKENTLKELKELRNKVKGVIHAKHE